MFIRGRRLFKREVVSNFRESGGRSKNSTFFLFAPKDRFGESFSKIIFKSSSEFLFWKKIRKFEIGQNVPNLHNFYWAFSAFSQRTKYIACVFTELGLFLAVLLLQIARSWDKTRRVWSLLQF